MLPSTSGPELPAGAAVVSHPTLQQGPTERGGHIPRWRRISSFPVFLAALVVAAAFITASWRGQPLGKIFAEGDTWWHLAVGERILATHMFPTTEPYSFTAAGTPWIAYGWLPEVLDALAARLGGLVGLSVLLLIESATFFLLVYYYARLRCGDWKAAAVTVAAILPISGVFVSPRPQLLGFICFVLTFICLEHFRAGRQNVLWWLIPIFMVWVNSHGTFLVGLGVIGLCWVSGLVRVHNPWLISQQWNQTQRRRVAVACLLSILALCVTPYGTRLASYPFEFSLLQGQIRNVVTEWQPLHVGESYGKALVAIVLFVLAAQAFRPVQHRLEDLVLFLGSAFYTCLHERFLIVFALAAVPMVAAVCAQFVPPYERAKDKPILNAVLIAALGVTLFALFPSRQELASAVARIYPQNALRHLQQNRPMHLWNEDTWGGYLIWASGGKEPKVFLDGRLDVYEYSGVLADYLAITGIESNTSFLLDKYAIDAVLIHRNRSLITYLLATGKWQRVYQDDLAVVLRRARPLGLTLAR